MVILQAALVSLIGYGLGVGVAAWFGQMSRSSESKLAFYMPSIVLVGTGLAVLMISMLSSVLSLRRVLALDEERNDAISAVASGKSGFLK